MIITSTQYDSIQENPSLDFLLSSSTNWLLKEGTSSPVCRLSWVKCCSAMLTLLISSHLNLTKLDSGPCLVHFCSVVFSSVQMRSVRYEYSFTVSVSRDDCWLWILVDGAWHQRSSASCWLALCHVWPQQRTDHRCRDAAIPRNCRLRHTRGNGQAVTLLCNSYVWLFYVYIICRILLIPHVLQLLLKILLWGICCNLAGGVI